MGQCQVQRLIGEHQMVVDLQASRTFTQFLDVRFDFSFVGGTQALWVGNDRIPTFQANKTRGLVEWEIDFCVVQHMHHNDIVTLVSQVLQSLQNFVGVVKEVTDQDNYPT
jgi:hypothetical protein